MLPPHLAERLEPGAPAPRTDGDYVVYWMRIAARVHENAALDVALAAARALGKPVFVYHALSERYRYASDRLHTFILEGARDVEQACAERGIGYAFHLERQGAKEPVLLKLAERAVLVVTDFMPVQPLKRWDAGVATVAPLWRVDASCVVPVWRVKGQHERAFTFRQAVEPEWVKRITSPWPDQPTSGSAWLPALPFEPLVLRDAVLPELVASCDIDHSVAPVPHTPGGSEAANARWKSFRDEGLKKYHRARVDPLVEGTSRMSAYLHFGHASALQLARDARARRSEGSDKFLDELLVWRELAWHFCRNTFEPESIDVLPAWALETLRAHERDPRPALPSWEQLARAQTGDLLWDAAQRQLLAHGELHNSLRMTWGKALLSWTRSPAEALATMVDLNHRYALDGRDPSSVGGILWCLGAFDRPFSPEQPILGTVRPRPLAEQRERVDVSELERRAHRPARGAPLTVAVIGAGVAGAAAARALHDAGHAPRLFDKGRAAGGRLSTRIEGNHRFDHGAPFFTVHDERFARWARSWWQERVLAQWRGVVEGAPTPEHPHDLVRLVGAPRMNAVVQRLLHGLDVHFDVEVKGLTRDGTRWRLLDAAGHPLGEYEAVVVATPAPQAAALIDPSSYALASRIRGEVTMQPTWSLLAHFPEGLGTEWDGLVSTVGPLKWLCRDSSKPERPTEGEHFVVHATADWSRTHLEETAETVIPKMLDAFWATTGARRQEPTFVKAHRWRYALTERALGVSCVWDEGLQLAVCGDWCLGNRVEDAFLSGTAAAARLNATRPSRPPDPRTQLTLTW